MPLTQEPGGTSPPLYDPCIFQTAQFGLVHSLLQGRYDGFEASSSKHAFKEKAHFPALSSKSQATPFSSVDDVSPLGSRTFSFFFFFEKQTSHCM